MSRPMKEADSLTPEAIKDAINLLKRARFCLRVAQANKSVEAVDRAIKSAEGAQRHAQRRLTHTCTMSKSENGTTE